ncbi:sulfotransferase [Pseudomonadota bacterium]
MLKGVEHSRNGRHIFVTGLARAGTTILLRALYSTKGFRSLTYRDMPFVLMPNVWKQLSKASRKYEDEKERAHGDRIQVSFDSPEAFEEVFWRTFCGDDYIRTNHLQQHSVDAETIDHFVEFVAQVLASSDSVKTSYLSKNNNNILRLTAIREAFPNAAIIIPFRDPVQQANSLLKQHLLFSERHQRDRFSYDYMRWLGHHEFGLTHKHFRFGTNESSRYSMYDSSNINYWVNMWLTIYSYVYEAMPEGSMLVCYESLCDRPAESMGKILDFAGVECATDSISTMFETPRRSEVEGLDQELVAEALSLYEKMREG